MTKTGLSEFKELERRVSWFRGISQQQTNACNDLLYALRDDIEQESTYRVRKCLTLLGLKPLLTSKQIKVIMGVSYGNDLAFLWFIWEAYYKNASKINDENYNYTVNEQLILSAIAHLDMPSTMRALDLILPTAEHSKKQKDMLRLRAEKLALKNINKESQTRTKVAKSKMLYLVPQVRPKPYKPKSEVSPPIDRKVMFPNYDNYKDTMYHIPNESSRWFASYEMAPAKREIKRCLSKALDLVFAKSEGQPDKLLCDAHQMLNKSAALKQQEFASEALQNCMKLLDIRGSEKLKIRKRILEELEEAVNCAAQKLRLYKKQQIMLLKRNKIGDCERGCQMCAKTQNTSALHSYGDGPQQNGDFTLLFNSDFDIAAHPLITEDTDEDQPVTVLEVGKEHLVKKVLVNKENCKFGYPRHLKGKGAYCVGIKAGEENKNCTQQNPIMEGKIKILNSKGKVEKSIVPSKVPFCAPQPKSSVESILKYCSRKNTIGGMPQWNYFKVFEPAPAQTNPEFEDIEQKIRSYCNAALDRAMDLPHNKTSEKGKNPIKTLPGFNLRTANAAAEQCAVGMIRQAANSAQITLNVNTQNNICKELITGKLHQYTDIDPEDTQTLLKMLKLAIDILKCNPHYVLVTLPNAHKLPILLDWIAERYGKTYNDRQMHELAKSTCTVYENLKRQCMDGGNFPLPRVRHFIGKHKCIESYAKFKEFECRAKQLRDSYHNKLNKDALEQIRLTWFALRCYTDLTGSLDKTYYAYMPASEQDFKRHHLWKSSEYRNMVFARQQTH